MSVALVKCKDYEQGHMDAAVRQALDLLGGIGQFVKPGMTVFLKANLMRKSAPGQAVTTHPAVVGAVAKLVIEQGARAIVGDSPGGPYNRAALEGIYAATGMKEMAEETGASLNYDCGSVTVDNQANVALKEFPIIQPLWEADAVINLCKLKSHKLTTFSGAVKNLYGVIPGLTKAELHFRFQELDGFSNMLADIAQTVKPCLNLVDAVWGMEGEGPGSGDPKYIGAILAAPSAFEADVAATRLVGYAFDEIPVLRTARERGLAGEEVQILGEALEDMAIADFVRADASDTNILKGRVPKALVKPLSRWLALRPRVMERTCVGCGVCKRTCPVGAITIQEKKASINPKQCIRCFCCMEFCPEKSIEARHNWMFRAAMRLTEGRR